MAPDQVVFTPALNQTFVIAEKATTFALYASTFNPIQLQALIDEHQNSDFTRIDLGTIGTSPVQNFRAIIPISKPNTEIKVVGNGVQYGKITLAKASTKGNDQEFLTEIILPVDEEFRSERIEWLDINDWKGWAWYRSRDTWIEARFTPLLNLDSFLATHNLLLQPNNSTQDPRSILAVFPASTKEAFVTLSAARDGEPPGVYARVRRVKNGSPIQVYVVGKLKVRKGTTNAISEAVEIARVKYGYSARAPFVVENKETPFDRLGFCTWSSIGENIPLTYDLMENLVKLLNRDKVPIGTFLIDDGWQDIRYGHNGAPRSRGLWSFATWSGMKSSLADNVALIKENLPTVKDIGVWMTLAGYWNSISPYSPLARNYEMRMYPLERNNVLGMEWPEHGFDGQQSASLVDLELRAYCLPPPHRAYEFWRDYFQSVVDAGITFVKVDNQAYNSFLKAVEGGEEFVTMWNSMTRAADEIFGENRVIHCMAHYERTFNGDIGMGEATKGRKIVIRNTDDFGLPRRNVHRDHIHYNLYNGILLSQQCLLLDADMFMTNDQWPEYHAVLRAFFNGPIFVADKPGVGDFKVHSKLTARSPGDEIAYRTIRTKNVIRPLHRNVWEATLDAGQGPSIRAGTYFPECESASIVLWNARSDGCDNSIDIIFEGDIIDALEHENKSIESPWKGVVWASNAAQATAVSVNSVSADACFQILASKPILSISVAPKSYEVLTVAPYHNLGPTKISVLGLIDKYAGLAALQCVKIQGTSLEVESKYDGVLGFILAREPSSIYVTVDGSIVEPRSLRLTDGSVLVKVDLTNATSVEGKSTWMVSVSVSA
ncbi:glycoside hydrolase superfamily [Talaromyces proteolyticus]|uniref:Glycoside hydrolase superfamily n=1 Tax=Talaromyces proteolyticus TaxID=1131652 RepID=A0AAD4KM58_9EURO|nr:glycoside hydrolase superfamily [Talaromyces proteolyticus]KAH8694852.1 glycoside hydrolase superfamily [Talaromyces proteolyticus]